MTCGWAVSAGTVGGAGGGVGLPGSHGEKLGFILSADSKILLETKNGILFFPHCLSFGCLLFRNISEELSELGGRISAHQIPFTHYVPISWPPWGWEVLPETADSCQKYLGGYYFPPYPGGW